jgi:hypothetical protein
LSNASGHTEEPLYTIVFASGNQADQFVEAVREAMRVETLHRYTPPGPLVIYGPRAPTPAETTLFVTAGILRAAELLRVPTPKLGAQLSGADALPYDVIVLFAHLGGAGLEKPDL